MCQFIKNYELNRGSRASGDIISSKGKTVFESVLLNLAAAEESCRQVRWPSTADESGRTTHPTASLAEFVFSFSP
jgi:hypothetical protein